MLNPLPRAERLSRASAAALAVAILVSPLAAQPQPISPDPEIAFDALRFRHIGPIGNRVPAVVGVPGDPLTYFAGAASGGIFRTRDGGLSWQPVFDDTPASSIGSLAVAPSDHNVIWAGTGETFIRSNVSIGNGIYRSTDGGTTWQHRGLDKTGRIGRIVIHPSNPDLVFAAAMGHSYGPQEERGLYRTRDGGDSWERVLFVDLETGAIDLLIDPNNPRILFAATWQFVMRTSGRESGGPGSGIYRSVDGGDTWKRLEGKGLPNAPWGKIGLAMSAADSRRVWALIETSSNQDFAPFEEFAGVLWRSDNGGDSWQLINRDNTLTQRPLYYTRAVAAPDNANEITFMAVQQSLSIDGGRSISEQNSGWDHHDLWIDPLDADRRIAGHDGGVSITNDRGQSWYRPQLPIAQLYHVAVDDQIPYFVYGNRQDGPSFRGPSNTLAGSEIPIGAWQSVGGCEVGFALPTPGDADTVWSGCYDGILERYDHRTGRSRDVSVWPVAAESWAAADLEYRFQWTFPIAISPHDANTVYVGSQYVHRTRNGGQSFEIISPDLTSNDPQLQQRSGGLTLDDAGPTLAPVVFAIAESALEPGVIWAGTNDGRLQVTRDGGDGWVDVTAALTDLTVDALPPLATIANVEPSRHTPGKVYVAIDRHQEGDTATYVYRSDDYGKSFHSLRSNLSQSVFGYAHCIREDPTTPGLLYLGTHNALWVSFDDGGTWRSLQSNLPPAPVSWITVQEHFNDLVLSTYGRGFWILDDITPIQQLAASSSRGATQLFEPRPAYRFRNRESAVSASDDPAAGRNPRFGATIHYSVSGDVKASDGSASSADDETEPETGDESEAASGGDDQDDSADRAKPRLEIVDASGEVVRTLNNLNTSPGLHRIRWDLQFERSPEVARLLPPRDNPSLPGPDDGKWRLRDGGRFAILAPPGDYQLRLELDGETHTSSVTLLADPTSDQAELAEQSELLRLLSQDIVTAAKLINDSEQQRLELAQLEQRISHHLDSENLVHGHLSEALDQARGKLEAIEDELFDLRLTPASQDTLRWQRRLYARLTYLARRIQMSDHRPTDAQAAVYELLSSQLGELSMRFRAIQDEELKRLNELLLEAQLAGVVSPASKPETSAPPG